MAYSSLSHINTAEMVPASWLQANAANWTWLASLLRNGVAISGLANGSELMPNWGAQAYNNANILHDSGSGSWDAMSFNTETFDTDGIWEGVTNPTRFTATRAGKYHVYGSLSWANNATGLRGIRFKVNGTASNGGETYYVAGSGITGTISRVVNLTAGQYVEFDGFQSSGGNLNMNTNGIFGIMGGIQWIGVV